VTAERLCAELASNLPHNALLYDESQTSGGSLEKYLRNRGDVERYRSRGGGVGSGLPGGLGLQVAHPDRKVVVFAADGSSMYTLQALWTAARSRLPVLFVIANNGGYEMLKKNYRGDFGDPEPGAWRDYYEITEPAVDLTAIAAGYGVPGRRVVAVGQLTEAIAQWRSSGGSYIVDVKLA
jgi:benzoylformate decarboxylase